MALGNPCRKGRHEFEVVPATIAGLGRRHCTVCGAVQIDLRDAANEAADPSLVFSARRPTLFSVRMDIDAEESFAVTAGLRAKPRRQ